MSVTKKISLCAAALTIGMLLPFVANASSLTQAQASAIVGLLQAFNVDSSILAKVESILMPGAAVIPTSPSDPTPPAASSTEEENPHVPVIGSVYNTSGMGYDLSFATANYPTIPFGFAVVGVTGGKAYVNNSRIVSEFSWAHFGSTAGPTLYMNLNAAYGSSATGANVSSPKDCSGDPAPVTQYSASAGGTFPEPSLCKSYNYGYNAAKAAYSYANTNKVSANFWWLDIEEANSWSENTAVNDATIQGAIDFLNKEGIHVGIYSMPYMWNNIGGKTFIPTQTVNGQTVSTPTWVPIGIMTQVDAINTCITTGSFIPKSPVWIVQYVDSSTSIDRNIAC